jgi:hypothetical protein
MGKSMTAEVERLAFGATGATDTPAGLEQYKLERLQELRAVIDSLRAQGRNEILGETPRP